MFREINTCLALLLRSIFSEHIFRRGGGPTIINMEGHITLNLLPLYRYRWYQNKYRLLMYDVTTAQPQKFRNWHFACKMYKGKNWFLRKNSWKHASFIGFLLNMLENDNSNLQAKFGLHITSNISKVTKLQNHGIASTESPTAQLWKLTLPPG